MFSLLARSVNLIIENMCYLQLDNRAPGSIRG